MRPHFLNDDARILEQIRKGDEAALAELYRANRRPIMSLVMRNSGGADDGEDMLQEALVTLWERVRTGKFEYSARLGTFLYATAKNIWLRRLARMRREMPGIDDAPDPVSPELSVLELMVEEEETSAVRRALEALGGPCRELLLLFYWEECPMDEIALKMGFANADTAKSKKYQCKKTLEKLLRGTAAYHA
jgi:RNA polymerase sigma factor (sigma-70 family)